MHNIYTHMHLYWSRDCGDRSVQLPCSPALAFLYLWPPSPLATIHGVSNTMQARASEFLEHHASPALVTRTPPQTHQAPQIALAGRGKGSSAAPGGRGHCVWVHRLPNRDHRRSPCELRCPASIALCFNDAKLVLVHGLNRQPS